MPPPEQLSVDQKQAFNASLQQTPREAFGLASTIVSESTLYQATRKETLKLLVELDQSNEAKLLSQYRDTIEKLYAERLKDPAGTPTAMPVIAAIRDAALAYSDLVANANIVHVNLGKSLPANPLLRFFEFGDPDTIKGYRRVYSKLYGITLEEDLVRRLPESDARLAVALLLRGQSNSPEINGLKLYRAAGSFTADPDAGILTLMRSMHLTDLKAAERFIENQIKPSTKRNLYDQLNSMLPRDRLEQARAILRGDTAADLLMEIPRGVGSLEERERLFALLRQRSPQDLVQVSLRHAQASKEPFGIMMQRLYGEDGRQRFQFLMQGDSHSERALGLAQLLREGGDRWKAFEVLMAGQSGEDKVRIDAAFSRVAKINFGDAVMKSFPDQLDLMDFLSLAQLGFRSASARIQRALRRRETTEAEMMGLLASLSAQEYQGAMILTSGASNDSRLTAVIRKRFPDSRGINLRLDQLDPGLPSTFDHAERSRRLISEAKSGLLAPLISGVREEVSAAEKSSALAAAIRSHTPESYPRIVDELSDALLHVSDISAGAAINQKLDVGRAAGQNAALAVNLAMLIGTRGRSTPAFVRALGIGAVTLASETSLKLAIDGASYRAQFLWIDVALEAIALPAGMMGGGIAAGSLRNSVRRVATQGVEERLSVEGMRDLLTNPFQRAVFDSLERRVGIEELGRMSRQALRRELVEETERTLGRYGLHSHLMSGSAGGFAAVALSAHEQARRSWNGGDTDGIQVLVDTATGVAFGVVFGFLPKAQEVKRQFQARQPRATVLPPKPALPAPEPQNGTVPPAANEGKGNGTNGGGKADPAELPGRKPGTRQERILKYEPMPDEPVPVRRGERQGAPPSPADSQPKAPATASADRAALRAPLAESELEGRVRPGDDAWKILSGEIRSGVKLNESERGKAREFFRIITSSQNPVELEQRLGGMGDLHSIKGPFLAAKFSPIPEGLPFSLRLNNSDRLVFFFRNGRWSNFWIGDYHD